MLEKIHRQAIVAAAKAAGVPPDKIAAMVAIADDRVPASPEFKPLLVNQATAARLLSVSRFFLRKLVQQGKLRQVILTSSCIRYSRMELEKLAASVD